MGIVDFLARHRSRLLAGLAGTYLLWAAGFIWKSTFIALDGLRYPCLFDDAMISMRYAHNLAHGSGLVWNAGERVEGYSNFLMVLLMAAASFLFDKRGAVLAVQVLGAALMLGIAWTVLAAARRVIALEGGGSGTGSGEGRPWVAEAAPVLAATAALAYYPLNYWSLMGMETGLLALLLGLATVVTLDLGLAAARGRELGWRLHGFAALMGLAFLTRMDALIFGIPLGLYLLQVLKDLGDWKSVGLRIRGPALLFAAVVAAHETFRLAYYGHLLPNTYALKLTGIPLGDRLGDGWRFVVPFLRESRYVMAAAVVALVLGPRKERLLLSGLGTVGLLYQIYNGGDPWDYWRIMSPGMPWLLLLGVLGFASAGSFKALALHARLAPVGLAMAVLGTALMVYKADHRFRREATLREPPRFVAAHANLVNHALAAAALTDSSATLGVFWAGTPPYYADRPAVDFLGKNDREIARRPPDTSGRVGWLGMRSVPGHNKYDLDYSIKTLLPTYVEGFRWGVQDLEPWAKDHYATAVYKGVRLHLLKDSPAVRWEKADSVIRWEGEERLRSW